MQNIFWSALLQLVLQHFFPSSFKPLGYKPLRLLALLKLLYEDAYATPRAYKPQFTATI